jgi:hypothetical protein
MGAHGDALAASETTPKHSLAKAKIDDFFIQWLSLPHAQEEIAALINDAKHDRPLQVAQLSPLVQLGSGEVSCGPFLSPEPSQAPSSPSSPRAALKQNQV